MIKKKLGFIGLGKMGAGIAERIIHSKLPIIVYDFKKENINKIVKKGACGSKSIEDVALKLADPKLIILCVPAGKTIDEIINQLSLYLSSGDTLIDLGNSFYKDTQRRSENLKKRGINFIDAGMSGGIDGARNGACLMIGGDKKEVSKLEYLFEILSFEGSYKYLGKSGAGHLVKGYHNLIEYGYLQSLAEGLESLSAISKKESINLSLEKVCDIWSKGSIIESRLVSDIKKAFEKDPSLEDISGSVYGQTLKEMQKLISIANKSKVKIYSCKAAVKARMDSQKKPTYSGKIINAARNIFGGHTDWKK
ncbi:NADP-dependent phosphogluconate dehydrogenase [Candidatus Desantisbacteria bacterium]|nr:NADP-dependent phosphogluconate dehydrogenase [Candidatus Desantisbacteria bacterium]